MVGTYPLARVVLAILCSEISIFVLSFEILLVDWGSWLQELLAGGAASSVSQFSPLEIIQTIGLATLSLNAVLQPKTPKTDKEIPAPEESPLPPKSDAKKLATLTIKDGDFQSGFSVTAMIWDDPCTPETFFGQLPPAPEMPEMYENCQSCTDGQSRKLKAISTTANYSPKEYCKKQVRKLEQYTNAWLGSEPFRPIADKLREKFQPEEELLLLIHADNSLLQRLPWHCWNFFEAYPRAQYALGALGESGKEFMERKPKSLDIACQDLLKILVVLGNAEGINIQPDREAIANFAKAEVIFLEQPTREKLNRYLWDEGGWDIFCFLGHSDSSEDDKTGTIWLNKTDKLAIADVKYALKGAISRGLQLGIFNSCDGLGLAKELADLHIPGAIVMREPVPDLVAQEFLQYFIGALASGKSLPLAVREAREKLQILESDFPSATWFPVIFQNRIWFSNDLKSI